MLTTPNMSLSVWDGLSDPYSHSQIATNFSAIDSHDHTSGKGARINTAALSDGAVTSAKIASDAITGDKIPNKSITQQEIALNSVGSGEIIDGSVTTPKIASGAVTFDKIDSGLIPLGTVTAWYRPNTSVNLPSGVWEVCDGRPWSSITNGWGLSSGNILDIRNKFILGAATTSNGSGPTQNPDIGQVGGSHTVNIAHTHTVSSHTHSVPSHTHSISADGAHTHSISADGAHSHNLRSRMNAFISGATFIDENGTHRSNTYQSIYIGGGFNDGIGDNPVPDVASHSHGGATGNAGSHSHGGSTGSASGTSGAASPATDSQISSNTDVRPAYVGLIYIMKVR